MELNRYIDHTLLKANATEEGIDKLVEEAKKYNFASVCVNPCWVKHCAKLLKGTNTKVCTVIGFPLGATSTESKIEELKQAIKDGATELDMVINIGKLKDKDYNYVENEIRELKKCCKDLILKVIIETCLLTDEEKVKVCKLALDAKADFVKTSTGFSTGGATVEDVKLMRDTVGKTMGVKASGGVRTKEDALKMIEAGATRIGTSNGIAIVEG